MNINYIGGDRLLLDKKVHPQLSGGRQNTNSFLFSSSGRSSLTTFKDMEDGSRVSALAAGPWADDSACVKNLPTTDDVDGNSVGI